MPWFDLALRHIGAKRYAEAIRELRALAESRGEDVAELKYLEGMCWAMSGSSAEAE